MEVKFAGSASVAEFVLRLLRATSKTIDAALYRLNNPALEAALEEAVKRGVQVRLLVDGNKYKESRATQELLAGALVPFRLAYGRQGCGTKMHHKFAILDQQSVLTGSYNWTLESENENHENLVILEEAPLVAAYAKEFEALWTGAGSDHA
jgi:cardiolipin hydrolase